MADQNDIEVRFGADTSELDGASKQAADDINQVSEASKKAATSTASLSKSQATAARQTQQMAEGHKQAASATRNVSDESVKLDQALTKLMSSLDSTYKNQVKFAEASELLHQNLEAGNITMAQHDVYLKALRESLGMGQKGMIDFGLSTSQAVNGVRALGDELASGRTRQATGTFMRLFTHFAAANPEIAAVVAGIVALGGAFAVGAVHAEEMDRAVNGIEVALTAVGHAGDLSRQQIEQYIRSMSQAPNISRDAAEEILAEFARMPEMSKPMFDQLQGMVSDFATATGQKAPAAARELAQAMEDPLKGALKLDKQLNFLTGTELEAIHTATEHGDTMKAQQIIIDALHQRIDGLTREGMTPLQQAENDVSTAWKNFMDALGHSGAIDVVRSALVGLLDTLSSVISAMHEFLTLKGFVNATAAIGAQDSGQDSSGYTANVLAAGQQKNDLANTHRQIQVSTNDVLAEQERHYKAALELAIQHSGKATERRKLETEINQLLAARKMAKTDDERKTFDQAISADREKLARVNKPHHAAGQASQMDTWRAQFEQMRANSIEKTGQEDYQAEIAFWQKKLSAAKAGSKQYVEIENEISRLRVSAARTGARDAAKSEKEAYAARIQTLREEQSANYDNMAQRLTIENQILAEVEKAYGKDSRQYQRELQRKLAMERQYRQQKAQDAIAEDQRRLRASDTQLAVEEALAQEKVKLHQMTEQQLTQMEIQEEQKRYQAHLKTLQDEQKLDGLTLQQRRRLLDQMAQLEAQHAVKLTQLQSRLAQQQAKVWTDAGHAAQSAITSSLQGMLQGSTTVADALKNVGLGIADSFIKSGVDMAANWIAQQLAIKTAGATTGASEIASSAATGAAAAYASTAAIPVVGPGLAPGAAATAYGSIMAYQGALSVASAAGGWEVPRDQLMQVHEKEVILPRQWAERFKQVTDTQAAANGGSPATAAASGGGDIHLHVAAVDGQSVKRLFNDHQQYLADTLRKVVRDGGRIK